MIFSPKFVFNSVTDITTEFLYNNNIKGLILDVDNTLTTHNNPKPAEKVSEWVLDMKSNGVKLIIVSNNNAERVKPFAETLGLDFIASGRKPLATGFKKARETMGISFSEIGIVGDQIFTDILGANIAKAKTIYVHPIELETAFFFKLKRIFEKPFLRKFK